LRMTSTVKQRRIVVFLGVLVLLGLFLWFVMPKLIVLFLPFILALLIAKIIEPVVHFLNTKMKIPRKPASLIIVTITVSLLLLIVFMAVYRIVSEINNLMAHKDVLAQKVMVIFYEWQDFFSRYLGDDVARFMKENIDASAIGSNLTGYLAGYIMPAIENMLGAARSLPNILIFTVTLIMGTYFLSSDKSLLSGVFSSILPKESGVYMGKIKTDMSSALLGYLRAQLILMSVTFLELTIGFTFMGGEIASYALLLGIIISIIDALPILGTGTVLIPWALYSLITGNTRIGISLFILYGICLLVRQILEPRVVGKQIGLHPLFTLMSMYIGLRLFGIFGLILGPVLGLILMNLYRSGLFTAIWEFVCYGPKVKEE